MKLKKILPYLDDLATIVIWDMTEDAENGENVFHGPVMDTPYYLLDFYLYNDTNGKAVDARFYDDEHKECGFVISVTENKPEK